MAVRLSEAKCKRLWERYWAITLDHAPGLYEPILWHLALRGDAAAMTTLADQFQTRGRAYDPFSKTGLRYRADRLGYEYASQHLAMEAFNKRDLHGYRRWLRRHARFGDPEAVSELKHFETRLPHATARKIGRQRPYRRGE